MLSRAPFFLLQGITHTPTCFFLHTGHLDWALSPLLPEILSWMLQQPSQHGLSDFFPQTWLFNCSARCPTSLAVVSLPTSPSALSATILVTDRYLLSSDSRNWCSALFTAVQTECPTEFEVPESQTVGFSPWVAEIRHFNSFRNPSLSSLIRLMLESSIATPLKHRKP